VVRLWIANPSLSSSNLDTVFSFPFDFRGRGGMVDTTDLKSVDFIKVMRVQVPPSPGKINVE